MGCLTLTVVIAGFSLLNVDGCLRSNGPPQVVEAKLPPAVTTDLWGEFVASTDRDPAQHFAQHLLLSLVSA
jgi:hypothetical protein